MTSTKNLNVSNGTFSYARRLQRAEALQNTKGADYER